MSQGAAVAKKAMPPKPKRDEIVTQQVLATHQRSALSLARGFAGTSDPTMIYDAMVRDDQNAFFYYRELEMKDDDVGGPLEQLKLSVLGRDHSVVPKDDSAEALRVAEFIQQQFDALPDFHQSLEALLDAPGHGVAISEMLFDVSAGQVALTDIKDCPQELFSFGERFQPQTGALRFMSAAYSALSSVEIPEHKFIVFTSRMSGRNRRGRPLLREIFWPSWFKRQTYRLWLRFAEKGPGTAAVQFADGASEAEKLVALQVAEEIMDKVAVALPANVGLIHELLTTARSQDPAVYENLITKMEMKIARRILGQTLTSFGSEDGVGSKGMGDTHSDTKQERVDDLARALASVINGQVIKPLVYWNYGPNAPMPTFSFVKAESEDLWQRSIVDQRMQRMGVKITKKYAAEKYGYPEVTANDEVLEPIADEPMGGDPAAAFGENGEARSQLKDLDRIVESMKFGMKKSFRQRIAELVEQDNLNRGAR